jgi:uncharacterized protein
VPTEVHRLTRRDARRLAVRAQWLEAGRPTRLLPMIRRLTLLQLDPIAAIAPSADLVAWSRLGSSYDPAQLRRAIDRRSVIELHAMLRPAADLALYRADMADWPGRGEIRRWQGQIRDWVARNDACRRDILRRLKASGPLTMRELPDTTVDPWGSTGWTNERSVEKLLGFMVQRGEVAVAGRRARERTWDLASRVYPDDPVVPAEDASRIRNERRLRALGIARPRGQEMAVEPLDVGDAGEPAEVEGTKGMWRVDPSLLGGTFTGRTALLSPFDRLVHDRKRAQQLFDFDFQLEMYKPAAQRRWGYYALPILHGDRLIGKLDATADRAAGVLRVDAIHEDEPFSKTATAGVRRELRDLAAWLDVELALPRLSPRGSIDSR